MVNGANRIYLEVNCGNLTTRGSIQSMEVLLLTFFCSYYCIATALIVGWEKCVGEKRLPATDVNDRLISVIIAARNEEQSIESIITDLTLQRHENFEVIIVDDHSTDNTRQVLLNLIGGDARVRVLSNTGIGKKAALTTGINAATGEIIVTTDADCRVQPDWLDEINQKFQDAHVKMLVGAVAIQHSHGLFSSVQTLEFASLIGSGVATLFFGIPTMCNGANLAFRKDVFNEVNGYADNLHIPSGDDEFLMKKIHEKYPCEIHFMGLSGAIVSTRPQATWRELLHQRIRWAGKWRYAPTPQKMALAIYIFLFQLFTILLPLMAWYGWLPFSWAATLWGVKVLVEWLFLWRVTVSLHCKWNWPAFTLLQLLYPFYVVVVGLFCNFQSFSWKERRLTSGKEKTG